MNVTTIGVASVSPAAAPLPAFEAEAAVRSLLASRVEAMSRYQLPLVGRTDVHPLVQAAYLAYTERCPLALSPDVVWLCLARGFTLHIAAHDELRQQVVGDDRDFELRVDASDLAPGTAIPWPRLLPEFSRQIAASVGELWQLVAPNFSTTGPVERLSAELSVATPFAPHFAWEPPLPGDRVFPERGIPSVELRGAANDWRWVRHRAESFGRFGLEHWTDALLPVLDQIIASAEGRPEEGFWRAFFRYENGADELTGWILVLFPYLRAFPRDYFIPSPFLQGWRAAFEAAEARRDPVQALGQPKGPGLAELPPGLSSAALRLVDAGRRERPMELVSGLGGVTQDPRSLALTPELVWAVVHPDDESSASA